MALLWIEGFDSFGTTTEANPSPSGVVTRKFPVSAREDKMFVKAGRLGGRALQFQYDNTVYISPGSLTTHDTLVVGCAVRFDGNFPAGIMFLAFYDGTTLGMNLHMSGSGEISVRRGSTVLATTSGLGLNPSSWGYLEFKVKCHDTLGTYELRLNGAVKLSASNVDTKAGATNNYHTTFRLLGTSITANGAFTCDDLYCLDGSGTANNEFLGNMRVVTIRPNADTANKDWTPSAGSDHYPQVDESVVNDDTDYVESATADHLDLFDFEDLAGISSGIKGIMVSTDCRETDATTFNLKTVVKSGATQSEDAAQAIGSTTYVTKRRLLEMDPDTAAAWTAAGVNSAQFGIKVG